MKKIILILLILIILLITSCTLFEKEKIYEPEILWRTSVNINNEYIIISSPSYYDGKVYVLTGRYFVAFDSETGELLYSLKYMDTSWTPRSSMYPEIDEERNVAYFASLSYLFAVDLETGEFKYIKNLNPLWVEKEDHYVLRDNEAGANAISLYRDELYLPNQDAGVVIVCDPETGTIKRLYDLTDGSIGVLMLNVKLTFEDDIMYVSTYKDIFALNISTDTDHDYKTKGYKTIYYKNEGVYVWSHSGLTHFASTTPLVHGDYVYFNTGTGSGFMYKYDKRTGELIWKVNGSNNSGLIYSNGKIIGASIIYNDRKINRGIRALDAKTGEQIWKAGGFVASPGGLPLLHNGKIYIAAGDWYCVDEKTGKQIWLIPGSPFANNQTPALNEEGNMIYFSKDSSVIAVKLE